MRLLRLKVDGLRCLHAVDIAPGPGLNVFLGGNGAGKTSVLEAAYVLGSGKSFRFGGHDNLIARDSEQLQVYAELEISGRSERLGFERSREGWRALRNSVKVTELAELATLVPVVCFSPESHGLVSGGADQRRRFLDWIVFHVEPEFSGVHRRYSRLLKQRNALLKQQPTAIELRAWSPDLALVGEQLAQMRAAVFAEFALAMQASLGVLLSELGPAKLSLRRGWREGVGLAQRLDENEARERALGYTLSGPHRCDWNVAFEGISVRDQGSRGQQKLVALASVLVAAQLYRRWRGEAPLIALDDLYSELDVDHQRRALQACCAIGAQTWVTGTADSAAIDAWSGAQTRFHVEHGRVCEMGARL